MARTLVCLIVIVPQYSWQKSGDSQVDRWNKMAARPHTEGHSKHIPLPGLSVTFYLIRICFERLQGLFSQIGFHSSRKKCVTESKHNLFSGARCVKTKQPFLLLCMWLWSEWYGHCLFCSYFSVFSFFFYIESVNSYMQQSSCGQSWEVS